MSTEPTGRSVIDTIESMHDHRYPGNRALRELLYIYGRITQEEITAMNAVEKTQSERIAVLEDQVRRLVHTLNAAGGALQSFDLAVTQSKAAGQ